MTERAPNRILRLAVLALAAANGLICLTLLAYGLAPGSQQATAGMGIAYALVALVLIGIPAAIAALVARANKALWLGLVLTIAPWILVALMFGWLSF